jgi:hypothetical protein
VNVVLLEDRLRNVRQHRYTRLKRARLRNLIVTGITKSSPEGGSIIAVAPDGDLVAVATDAIRLFKTK